MYILINKIIKNPQKKNKKYKNHFKNFSISKSFNFDKKLKIKSPKK